MAGSVEDRIRLDRSPGPGAKGGIDLDGENGSSRFERKGGHWRRAARAGGAARSCALRGARAPTGDGRGSSLTQRTRTRAWHGPKAVRRTQRRMCACHSCHDGFTQSSTTPPPWSLCPTSHPPWSLCPTSQNGRAGVVDT